MGENPKSEARNPKQIVSDFVLRISDFDYDAPVPSASSPLRLLFIGNSFTARNDLPGTVARLAAAAGHRVEPKLISVGGASLRTHWNKGDAPAAFATGAFGHVVLQEQSTLPIKNAQRFHENVRLFDAAIKQAGSETVLYMTWARKHAPDTQKALTDAYTSIARDTGATLVPAGVAWQRFMAKHDKPVLHDKDGSHPTPAGSYLAACVFFAVLFRRTPEGLPADVPGVTAPEAKLLQQAAWSVR